MAYIGNKPGAKYATLTRQTFSSPTGTSHTLSQTVTNSDDLLLYINNVKQNPADYTASGTTLTTASLASGTEMYCLYYGKTTETVAVPSDSVDGSHIVDNAVTLAKMAGGTDGQIITYDASGDPVAVGPGTDGQVLTSTGAGSPPAFEDASGGVDGIVSSANATAITIDSDEKVGIGITSPGSYEANSSHLVVGGTGHSGMTIVGGTAHTSRMNFADGTSGDTEYRGYVRYRHNNDDLTLGSSGADQMLIDANGHITMPNQSAFSVRLTTAVSNVTGDGTAYNMTGSGFWTEIFDQNADFDTTNGTFTAPVTGRYLMCCEITMSGHESNNTLNDLDMITSNRTYRMEWGDMSDIHSSNVIITKSFSQIVDMDASDTVYLRLTCGASGKGVDITTGFGSATHFQGALIA